MRVGRHPALVLALVLMWLTACESESLAPEAAPTPTEMEASPTPTDGPEIMSCRGLEVPFDREVKTSLDRDVGTLEFAYRKAGRNQQVTIRYRDDPSCRRNRDTRSLIFHVGAGRDILGCLDLPTEPTDGVTRVKLWFTARDDPKGFGTTVVVERDLPTTDSIARATMQAWIEGPTREERAAGALRTAPMHTELLGIGIDEDTATVDLTEDFERTGLGTTYEGAILEALAGTLTQFDGVERGLLMIDGEFKDYYLGHGFIIDEQHPLTRPGPRRYRVAPSC